MTWPPGLQLTTPPTDKPVSLEEAKHHLRVDGDSENDYIDGLIEAATNWVQEFTGRQLITASWTLVLDNWPQYGEVNLPRPPVASLTTITYYLADATSDTFADVTLDNKDDYGPHRIWLNDDASWPTASLRRRAAIEIEYQAGYGDPADVPAQFKTGIKNIIGSLYEHRETEVIGKTANRIRHSTEWLLFPYRVWD